MENATRMKQAIRAIYAARIEGDLEGALTGFADDAVFQFNSDGADLPGKTNRIAGITDIRTLMAGYIDSFQIENWKEISLIVEGDHAVLHWRADVTFSQVGRSAPFDVFDFITFQDGKIVHFHETTDTAKMKAVIEGPGVL